MSTDRVVWGAIHLPDKAIVTNENTTLSLPMALRVAAQALEYMQRNDIEPSPARRSCRTVVTINRNYRPVRIPVRFRGNRAMGGGLYDSLAIYVEESLP